MESSHFSFCHAILYCEGRGDLFCPPKNRVCILLHTLFPTPKLQQPSGAFQCRVMEHEQGLSQVEQCQGRAEPWHSFLQAHRGSRGCRAQRQRGQGGRQGWVPAPRPCTPCKARAVPSEAHGVPCLPHHLGFKCLSHTLGVAAKHCAFSTSLHLDFKPLQLAFGSGFQAFSSPISYPHWFPL